MALFAIQKFTKWKIPFDDLSYIRLYTERGDILINKFLSHGKTITKDIVKYYQEKYFETFVKYGIDSKCVKEDSIKYIECYILYVLEKIESLHNIIKDRLPKVSMFLFRGISLNKTNYDDVMKYYYHNLHKVIQSETFISTSLKRQVAEQFSKRNEKSIIMIIYVSNTFNNYIPILGISKIITESEILLNIGTKLYVDKIDDNIIYCQAF